MWFRHSGQHTFMCVVLLNDTLFVASSPEGRDEYLPAFSFSFGHGGGAVGLELVHCFGTADGGSEVKITDCGRQEEGFCSPAT